MTSVKIENLMKQIQGLDPAQRAELRRQLDSMATEPTDAAKLQELDRCLLQEGLLSRINPVDEAAAEPDTWEPVVITGRPISESLIEERR